ncbi:glutathione peroxidase [Dysgonomonas hofstadii]|uniref:Glutathione peroxidase n=1 Tax=Dysgonomonas hofstadii TaxID=637886 RepID=A0A840CX01_9BACT|nr:glutathione peroxidase [Dysgonomonas hofstadii]
MSVYDFKVKDIQGNDVSLDAYKGKVLLIVNTAIQCGFTPQYKDLQNLYLKYKDKGFEILDFPCNQFGSQALGTNEEIASFCEMKYKTTFKTFGKIYVNGENADPLYKYLKANSKGFLGESIKWNFTKFLVNRQGNVVDRYAPITSPAKISRDIEELLSNNIKKAIKKTFSFQSKTSMSFDEWPFL